MSDSIAEHLDEAEAKAWDSLSRYKFMQFGYWAAIWVHLNRISGARQPNPWKAVVLQARNEKNRRQALSPAPGRIPPI